MTQIEWTQRPGTKGETWNPVVGCSRVSPGCENCYAESFTHRGLRPEHRGLTVKGRQGVRWNGTVRSLPERLVTPTRWRKPRTVFVNSLSDLFHERVDFDFVDRVFEVMRATPEHTYLILTKRPTRMFVYMRDRYTEHDPLPNVWLGTSIEDQQRANERLMPLLACKAAVRFVSVEPMLGPVDLGLPGMLPRTITGSNMLPVHSQLDWIICGGESGPGARPFDLRWPTALLEEAQFFEIPFFMKQLGAKPVLADPQSNRKGSDPADWPPHLRVRQWPQMESL